MEVQKPSILIFRYGQLGDTLIAMPAIEAVRRQYPRHRLILLTDRHPRKSEYVSSWDVLGPAGWFDEVIFYTPAKDSIQTACNMFGIAKKLRKQRLESVFDFSSGRSIKQSVRDRFFFRWIVGVTQYMSYGACSHKGRNADGTLPWLEPEWKRLGTIVGGDIGSDFRLPIPAEERQRVQDLFAAEGISSSGRLLAVGPGSKMPAKKWPKERFAELGKRLLNSFQDVDLLVMGGNEDRELGLDLCSKWGIRSHNLAGKLSIYGSAAALERCAAYIGNDTGTMHLSAMVGIPCVALFSARDWPGKWEPYGTSHKILRTDIECAGCMLEICSNNNACLCQISVAQVKGAVEGILDT